MQVKIVIGAGIQTIEKDTFDLPTQKFSYSILFKKSILHASDACIKCL